MKHVSTDRMGPSLSIAELSDRLLPLLSDLFAPQQDPGDLMRSLGDLRRIDQELILHWADIIARTNAELAYQFARNAPRARALLGPIDIEAWILQAMDAYDHEGLYAAVRTITDLEGFVRRRDQQRSTVTLKQVGRVVETFLQGLSGRHLALEPGDSPWTDTETVYLPSEVSLFPRYEDNFSFAKCLAAMLWAQARFGSFAHAENGALRIQELATYDDTVRAQQLFAYFENYRLLSRIEHELPGLAREVRTLIQRQDHGNNHGEWTSRLISLTSVDASVADSLDLVKWFYPKAPPATPFNGITVNIGAARATIAARMTREREALLQALGQLAEQASPTKKATAAASRAPLDQRFQLQPADKLVEGGGLEFNLALDGAPVSLSPALLKLLQSIVQDIGTLPADFLTASGSDALPQQSAADMEQADEDPEYGEPYPEWDFRRRHYRRDWCFVRETDVREADPKFIGETLIRHAGALPRLRKTFEALRSEDRWLCRQRLGDDLDLNAVVDSLADQRAGLEADDRLYRRLSRSNRNIAVLFMVDMSGSTKGWVNEAEREALVLLCEALQILGDRYAIYGFSGMTRKRCEIFKVKRFDETYSDAVRARIAGIEARDYTRMGVSIRYLNKLLETVQARTKLLITLSDGKPDDFDGYGGEYGIEDTRQALIESRRSGIHPFCITIDSEARDYLPHMYGRHSFAVIDKVHELPLKVADIYRRLTH